MPPRDHSQPTWDLVGVPYTSARETGGISRAISVLRAEGLAGRLNEQGIGDAGDLRLQPPTGERGPSGLLNEHALGDLVDQTQAAVAAVRAKGRKPALVGGDCPVLLGGLAAVHDEGFRPGLVMIDGHEDAWPPRQSETGEASDCELGIALGLAPDLPAALDRVGSVLDPSALALIGPRDQAEIQQGGVESLAGRVGVYIPDSEVEREPQQAAAQMRTALDTIDADRFWLHLDLDCLSVEAFSAIDYPQEGGLDWVDLDALSFTAIRDPRCYGVSVVIYNPDLDPAGNGARGVVDYMSRLLPAC